MWAFDGDRDPHAAVNLAQWAQYAQTDPRAAKQSGGATTARRGKVLVSALCVLAKPARMTREPAFVLHPQHDLTTSEKGGADAMFGTL
jgi:hypothetical protein